MTGQDQRGNYNLAYGVRPGLLDIEEIPWDFRRRPDLIELQFGENHEDISPRVAPAIAQSIRYANVYPDLLAQLTRTISKSKSIPEARITVVNGTDGAFRLLSEVFVTPGDECLLFPPTYPPIRSGVEIMQGRILELGLTEEFKLPSISAILEKLTGMTKIVYLANPNTPTGNMVANREAIIQLLQHPVIVIVDECYYEMTKFTIADLVNQYTNLVITRSLSKTYGLAGLRIGYIIAHEDLSRLLRLVQLSLDPFLSLPSMAGAIAAIEDENHLHDALNKLTKSREILKQGLESLGLQVYPSETTSLLVDTNPVGLKAKQFISRLASHGILTKTCEVYGLAKDTWVYFGVPRLDKVRFVLDRVQESLRTG